MTDRINKSVSFSTADPFEKELLGYALNQGNFSKYVKRLILMDKEFIKNNIARPQQIIVPDETEEDEKLQAIKSINIL